MAARRRARREPEERIIAAVYALNNEHDDIDGDDEHDEQPQQFLTQPEHIDGQAEQLQDDTIQWMIQLIKQHGHDKPRQATTSNEEQQQFLSEYNRFVIRDNVLFYSTSRNDIKLRNVRHKHLIAVAFNKLHTSAYGGHLGQQRTLHRFN